MKSKCVTTVISLSPAIHSVMESAISVLSSARQDAFAFEMGGSMELPASATPETPRLWSELEAVLTGERKRRKCELLVGVLNEAIENNWFSHSAYGKNVAWITAHDWEFYSDLPVVSFVAYDIVLNVVLMLLVPKPQDEAWLMGEVVHIQEARECISDLCAYKPDIARKIRSGGICKDCSQLLASKLGQERLVAVLGLLGAVRDSAIAELPRASAAEFPGLRKSWKRARGLLDFRRQQLRREQEEVERQLAGPEARIEDAESSSPPSVPPRPPITTQTSAPVLKDAGKQEQPPIPCRLETLPPEPIAEPPAALLRASPRATKQWVRPMELDPEALTESTDDRAEAEPPRKTMYCYAPPMKKEWGGHGMEFDRPGIHHEIERKYPFPIAYCFRAMRAELNPTDRWLRLYDLYKLIIRYVTFVLLADRADRRVKCSADLGVMVEGLKHCSDGMWGKTCMGMIRLCREKLGPESVVFGFLDSLGTAEIGEVENLSRAIVKDRDFKQGHGFVEEAAQYQGVFEKYLPGMKRLLVTLARLAECPLIRPVHVLQNCDGECVFDSKVLVGADTIFEPWRMHSTCLPETVCQLVSPNGERRLSLHPWLHLDRCETCQREMVFLFHEVSGYGDRAVTKLREYPSNHEKERPDLTGRVLSKLRVGT